MKNLPGAALVLAALFSACSQDKQAEPGEKSATSYMMAPPVAEESSEADRSDLSGPPAAQPVIAGAGALVPASRLIIYHAELRLKVDDLSRSSARLDSLVRRSGGYLSAAEETRTDGEWRQEMTIRVKPGQFTGLMGAIAGLGTLENKKLTTDDVTAEHADVAARLATKRAVEQRYVALLGKARKISEVLEIEEKIGEVREAIESTEGRLKTMNDEVAYSTISLTSYQPLAQPTPDAPIMSLGSRVVEAFYNGWSLLTSLMVGLVAIWPLLFLGTLGTWLGRRWWRKNRLAQG